METYREMESVVERYEREVWEYNLKLKEKEKPPLWLYPYTAEYIVLGQHLLLLYKKLFTFRYLQIQTILRQPH